MERKLGEMPTRTKRPRSPHSSPTLIDVSRLAGVGLGTASRALSGQGYVSDEAISRIQAAAERLGYQRNEIARSLKVKRSGSIGLVVPDIGGPFMATCVRHLQKVLRQDGYNSIIAFTDGDEAVEAEEIDYLTRHQIDGLIIVPANGSAPHLMSSRLSHLPVVAFDHPISGDSFDSVLTKNRQGARSAVRHLIEHGHRDIACIGVYQHLYSIQKRIEGYREAMKEANLQPILSIVDPENDGIRKQLDRWMASQTPPTAVFSLNELTSLELVEGFSVRGIQVPKQIAFIGFDDIQLGPYLDPPLSAVLQPSAQIGALSATRLLERLHATEKLPGKRIMLDAQLILRRSCGCSYSQPNSAPAVG